ncbi:DUF5681 domain-containing protein [Gammaproteobacteria bacterium]
MFKEGQSGNPAGRPRGIKDRRVLFAEIIDSRKNALIDKATEMALAGNEAMLKLFLERLLPAKPKDDSIELNVTGSNFKEKTNQITELMNQGEITLEQANTAINCIEKTQEIEYKEKEFDTLVNDIADIKAARAKREQGY